MSTRRRTALVATAGALTLAMLAGCTYDYVQRTDRVGYSAGDAVKANLEMQTADPSRGSSYSVRRLGENGVVVYDAPDEDTGGGAGDE